MSFAGGAVLLIAPLQLAAWVSVFHGDLPLALLLLELSALLLLAAVWLTHRAARATVSRMEADFERVSAELARPVNLRGRVEVISASQAVTGMELESLGPERRAQLRTRTEERARAQVAAAVAARAHVKRRVDVDAACLIITAEVLVVCARDA